MKYPVDDFFVLDIETLGDTNTPADCALFEFAMIHVKRDENGQWPEIQMNNKHIPQLRWNTPVNKDSVDMHTLMFHEKIRGVPAMRTNIFATTEQYDYAGLAVMVTDFMQLHKTHTSRLVARRPQFDLPRLELLLKPHGFSWPIPYTHVIDIASLDQAIPGNTFEEINKDKRFTSHYAQDDCMIEAEHFIYMVEYFNALNGAANADSVN